MNEQSASDGIHGEPSDFEFVDVLPHLATLYRNGVLVPFLGAGMSAPACAGWTKFLTNLADEAGAAVPKEMRDEGQRVEAPVLYRLADATVERLRPLSPEQRADRYREALRTWAEGETATIPPQTASLAGLYWPLVLTTNYDDLYCAAALSATRVAVLGRHLADCHRILRSLDEHGEPLLWALQGFVGGQRMKPEEIVPDAAQRRSLADQVVAGHQQYQRAVNAEAHFRRAFGEVFRRRSLLFLGSGVLEDYFVNLFSEVMHHYGPGRYPHFAMLPSKQRERFDPSFLQARLGIVPVFYDFYDELPDHLNRLAALVRNWPVPAGRRDGQKEHAPVGPASLALQPDELGFCIRLTREGSAPVRVTICNTALPVPDSGALECSLVSVGRGENNMPLEGNSARTILEDARVRSLETPGWMPLDAEPSYVYRNGDGPIFGLAARHRDLADRGHDHRDLGIIPESVHTALDKIAESQIAAGAEGSKGFRSVHIGPIASGKLKPWHAIHAFAQTLVGVRRFLASGAVGDLQYICLHVVDPKVWYPVVAGKVPIPELLSSEVTTHRVEIRDTAGNVESIVVTSCGVPTLGEVLARCKVERSLWRVQIVPHPTGGADQALSDDMVLAPTMRVVLTPAR